MKPNFTAGIVFLLCFVAIARESHAGTVTFGSGANTFSMEFVTIGSAGNAPDTTGEPNHVGSVGYEYDIGKFEVSRYMIERYNSEFGASNGLEITLNDAFQVPDTPPVIKYGAFGFTTNPNLPATGVTWKEAARFVNWLNTSSGHPAAYKFSTNGVNDNLTVWSPEDLGFDARNPFRNRLARYALPSSNEWYKAAYYDPQTSNYWDFPTASNYAPKMVFGGTEPGSAVYGQSNPPTPNGSGFPAFPEFAGGLSPFGVMGLGGNVWEWEESSYGLLNLDGTNVRIFRGGDYTSNASALASSNAMTQLPSQGGDDLGFRVVSISHSSAPVPEPSMMMIGTLVVLGGLVGKRRVGISKPRRIELE